MFNNSLDLLIIINSSSEGTRKSYTHSLNYWKNQKNLNGTKIVTKLLLKLRNELLVH
jgi:hypothetical protein